MKKLANIARDLSQEEVLNQVEAAEVKGGRRFVTKSLSVANSVFNYLKFLGKQPSTARHGGEYCIEW